MANQLQPIDLVAPGFLGLNFAQSGSLLSPEYSTKAENAVIDTAGRLAARKGFLDVTTTDITGTPAVESLFEYATSTGAQEVIVAWDGGIANDVADPETNDISGAVTDADGRWWFQNFNNKCVGFQDGQKPIVYNGAGTFATVVESSGTAPTIRGGIGLAAYGRVWGLDADGSTIKYSGLLDETDWGGAGAGQIGMHNVWTDGTDEVTAIWAFNGSLVVFGKRHIVIWTDGQGSALGLDPDFISVADVLEGTGCVTQWSIQAVGEADLLYLSPNGVQSMGRLIQERSNPVTTLTKYVRDELRFRLADADVAQIRSTYSPEQGFYLLSFPDQNITWCLDQRRRYIDDDQDFLSIITTWDLAPRSWLRRDNGTLHLGDTHGVGTYGGADDNGSTFRFIYESPWLDLGEDVANRLKMLKRIGAILFVKNNTDIVFKWNVDFDDGFRSITRSVSADASAEWGVGEWGAMEWSGGLTLRILKVPARNTGQYYRVSIEADVNGDFAVQQMELFTKIGRIA